VTDRVEATLAYEGRPPKAVIATHPATGLQLSVHAAAVNAVMAGCLPEYFPVLIAAFEAMDKPEFNFHGSTASTGGSAPLLIVSGPVADDIGMNADVNLFGPGNRANATIGRAVRLILRNVFQMIPGISDKSTQGHPGKYSFCIAERARGNPWQLLCEVKGYPPGISSVTVFAAGGFCNVENHGGNTAQSPMRWRITAASHWVRASWSSRRSICVSLPMRAGAARMLSRTSLRGPSGRSRECGMSPNTARAHTTSSTMAPRIRLLHQASSIGAFGLRIF
jgi:hypothetical protein